MRDEVTPANPLHTAARWLADLRLRQASEAARAVARDCVVDTLGVALAGANTDVWRRCTASLGRDDGPCRLWGRDRGASAPEAAFANAVAAHAWDFDDTSYAGIVHASAVVLPAAWAACEMQGATGADLLTAFIGGVEIEYALGLAFGEAAYHRGHWTTATLGVVGAAGAAAKALGLDAEHCAHALGIAMATPIGLRAIHGSSAKPYICGLAARLGLEAALAARAGVQCTQEVLTHRFGFAQLIGGTALAHEAFGALGRRWCLVTPGVALKAYPLCSATQAAIEAALELRERHGLRPSDIARIECEGTRLVVDCLPYEAPATPQQAQFSMQFALACALLHGAVGIEHLHPAVLEDAALRVLMQKVALRPASAPFEDETRHPEGATVRIHLHDGSVNARTLGAAAGMPQRPFDARALRAKFMACARFTDGPAPADALFETLRTLDTGGADLRAIFAD